MTNEDEISCISIEDIDSLITHAKKKDIKYILLSQ